MEVAQFKKEVLAIAADPKIKQEKLEAFIYDFFLHKPIPIVLSSYPHFVRCSINHPREVFKNVARCSYNPNATSVGLMRCNYPGQQVFYAAVPASSQVTPSMTAMLETAMEHVKGHNVKKHRLTLSRWVPKRKLNLFIFPFSKESIVRNDDLKIANDHFDQILLNTFGAGQMDAIQYFRDSLEFMSDVFAMGENKLAYYRISSAFYNCIMKFAVNKRMNTDGMLYSSANTLSAGLSIVLKKELVDDGTLKCDYVQMYELQRSPSNPKDITFDVVSDSAVPDLNGNFTFGKILPMS